VGRAALARGPDLQKRGFNRAGVSGTRRGFIVPEIGPVPGRGLAAPDDSRKR
jgi:hypothetical protein